MRVDQALNIKAQDAITSKAQQMVGSQAAFRALDPEARRSLRQTSRKLLVLSDFDNPLKQRIDSKVTSSPGFVYLIANKAWPNWVKVGRSISMKTRLQNYQCGSPYRDFEVVAKLQVTNTFATEYKLLLAMSLVASKTNSEWFEVSKTKAKQVFIKTVGGRDG